MSDPDVVMNVSYAGLWNSNVQFEYKVTRNINFMM